MKINLFTPFISEHSFYRSANGALSLCVGGVRNAFPNTVNQDSISVDIRVTNPRKKGFKKVNFIGDYIHVSGKKTDVTHGRLMDFKSSYGFPDIVWVKVS